MFISRVEYWSVVVSIISPNPTLHARQVKSVGMRGHQKKFNVGPSIGIRPSEGEEAARQTTRTWLHKKEKVTTKLAPWGQVEQATMKPMKERQCTSMQNEHIINNYTLVTVCPHERANEQAMNNKHSGRLTNASTKNSCHTNHHKQSSSYCDTPRTEYQQSNVPMQNNQAVQNLQASQFHVTGAQPMQTSTRSRKCKMQWRPTPWVKKITLAMTQVTSKVAVVNSWHIDESWYTNDKEEYSART